VPLAHGEVHDDKAYVMGGVAGHAGLFGSAWGVLEVGRAWLENTVPGLDSAVRDLFWRASHVPGSTRRLGFDGPDPDGGGSAGQALSRAAVGHTGFTGTSLWIDPRPAGDGRIFVLLSNAVHPTRNPEVIKAFRPRFHEAAARL
jgi:CubicO group peptidase (beta-lactamase class C family)